MHRHSMSFSAGGRGGSWPAGPPSQQQAGAATGSVSSSSAMVMLQGAPGVGAPGAPSRAARRAAAVCNLALSSVARCVPRSASFLSAVILFVIFGLLTTIVYGRSLTAVIVGVVGIIASLEAIFHIRRRQFWFLPWYAGYLLAQTAVCVAVGATVLTGAGLSCSGAANPAACTNSQVVYGLIMALGSSSVGVFAAINSAVVYFAMRGTSAAGVVTGSSSSSSGGGLYRSGVPVGGAPGGGAVIVASVEADNARKLAI